MKVAYLVIFSVLCCFSCSDADDPKYRFELPELTPENTIRFDVTTPGRQSITFHMGGNRLAVDWGDGTIDKYVDAKENSSYGHTYAGSGTYTVKIWSDELSFLNLMSMLRSYSDLKIGKCPVLQELNLGSVPGLTSFDGDNTPALKSLTITNSELSSCNLRNCTELEELACCTMPNLADLDVSNNNKLLYLQIFDTGIAALTFGENTELGNLECLNNKNLADIDLHGAPNLYYLAISDSDISALDVSFLTSLRSVLCNGNKLTTLDLSNNKALYRINIGDNRFEAGALNAIFTDLPVSRSVQKPNIIWYEGNPGSDSCDSDIILQKGWKIYKYN